MRSSRHPRFATLTALGLLAIACSPVACSAVHPDPRQLFLQAAAAAEAIPRVSYRFEATIESGQGTRRLDGDALIERLDLSGASYRARIDSRDTAVDGTATRLVAVRQRDDVYLLDPVDRVAKHASLYAGGSSLLYRVDPALMYAFFDPRAIASEAEAMSVEYAGRDEVLGEPCHMVRVSYADDEDDSRWCLGVDDHLPRLMEWIGAESTTRLEIGDIEVPGPIDDALEVQIASDWTIEEVAPGPAFGAPAGAWSLALADGSVLRSDDLLGEVIVLDFWATWCPPCLETLDRLESLTERYRDRPVRFIAVNTMESGDALSFTRERGYTFDVGLEGDHLHALVAPGSLPAFAVIGADGRWAGIGLGYYGEGSDRHMERLVEAALARSDEA